MQKQQEPNLSIKEELRLQATVRFIAFLLIATTCLTGLALTIERYPQKGMLIPLAILSSILIVVGSGTFLVLPIWYRYRHTKNKEEDQDTELFP